MSFDNKSPTIELFRGGRSYTIRSVKSEKRRRRTMPKEEIRTRSMTFPKISECNSKRWMTVQEYWSHEFQELLAKRIPTNRLWEGRDQTDQIFLYSKEILINYRRKDCYESSGRRVAVAEWNSWNNWQNTQYRKGSDTISIKYGGNLVE